MFLNVLDVDRRDAAGLAYRHAFVTERTGGRVDHVIELNRHGAGRENRAEFDRLPFLPVSGDRPLVLGDLHDAPRFGNEAAGRNLRRHFAHCCVLLDARGPE